MPKILPQTMKSIKHIALQPDKLSSKMHLIVMLDIAGVSGNSIAEQLGYTPSRVSLIRNSPLYLEERDRLRNKLALQFMDKKSDALVTGDPVTEKIKDHCLEAVETKIAMMRDADSEFVRASAAGDILDRAGYKSHSEKTKITVEVTERMADRFERVMGYERNSDDGQTTIRVENEMSK